MTARRHLHAPLEKVEQAHTQQLLHAIGAVVYTIGTRRPKGKSCRQCGAFVPDSQGTRQTPGLPDLLAFLPSRATRLNELKTRVLFVEQKRVSGRLSPEQEAFRSQCRQSATAHVTGTYLDVLAWLEAEGYVQRVAGSATACEIPKPVHAPIATEPQP